MDHSVRNDRRGNLCQLQVEVPRLPAAADLDESYQKLLQQAVEGQVINDLECEQLRTRSIAPGRAQKMKVDGSTFIVAVDRYGIPSISRVVGLIDAGNGGKIKAVIDFSEGKVEGRVVKFARRKDRFGQHLDPLTSCALRANLRNEYQQLRFIHQLHHRRTIDGALVGIQQTPVRWIELPSPLHKEKRLGYIVFKYDDNGLLLHDGLKKHYGELDSAQCVQIYYSMIKQLFIGLQTLQSSYIVHGDIKPENIYLTYKADFHLTACLGDFGGAKNLSNFGSAPRRTVYTPEYICQADEKALELTAGRGPRREILLKGDIFGLSVSIYEIVTNLSYYQDDSGQSIFECQQLLDAGIAQGLVELLEKGVSLDYAERPTPQEFIQWFADNGL